MPDFQARNDAVAIQLALQWLKSVGYNMGQFVRHIPMCSGVVDISKAAERDRYLFADALASAWPMDEASSFDELLKEIDASSMRLRHRRH